MQDVGSGGSLYTLKSRSSLVWQEHKWSQGDMDSDHGEASGMEMATQSTLLIWKSLRTTCRKRWHMLDIFTGVGCHFLLQCMKVKN